MPDRVIILTPLKDAAQFLPRYVSLLSQLSYPHDAISVGLLESDSRDASLACAKSLVPRLRAEFRQVSLWQKSFGFHLPPGVHRSAPAVQMERRRILAQSRNHLLSRALRDEDWVLWLDVDVIQYPVDIIERLLATGKDIVQPHCVLKPGGPTFDCNAWVDRGRLHMDALRGGEELIRLDAVGGTMLLVRADIHRDGLVFPPYPYGLGSPRARPGRGEIETEGLALMAYDMGHECWGMPGLEILHAHW